MAEELKFIIRANIGQVKKDTEKLLNVLEDTKQETKKLEGEFGAFGITVDSVKQKFRDVRKIMTNGLKQIGLQARLAGKGFQLMFGGEMKIGARVLFNVIKTGIAATGIGLLLVAFGSLVAFFKSSEEGASKFKQITAALGVVVGNVSDIISDLGKAIYRLFTEGIGGFKDSLADAVEGIKVFGAETKREMGLANQLEKDRLALQKEERKHTVERAKTERDIMELRLKSRDIEKFNATERLGFMREANKLAEDQLSKDLEIAEEKLRMQQIENSLSTTTEEDLNKEAELRAEVFNVEKKNFSTRKRMKSEEQTLVKQLGAIQKKIDEQAKKDKQELLDLEEERIRTLNQTAQELLDLEEERIRTLNQTAEDLINEYYQNILDAEDREKNAVIDKYFSIIEAKKAAGEDTAELEEAQEEELKNIRTKYRKLDSDENQKILDAKASQQKLYEQHLLNALSNIKGLFEEGSDAAKAAALVEIAVNTGLGFIQGLDIAQKSAKALGPGAVYAFPIFYASQIAAVLGAAAQAKQILGSGGGSNAPVPATTSATTPSPQIASGAFTLGGGTEPEPTRAYVVSDDITNSQNKLANIRRRATI